MSYDVAIGDWSGNTTFNHRIVFERVVPRGLHGLHGLTGSQASKSLALGLIHNLPVIEEELRFEMEGCAWGSYEAAVQFLRDLHLACQYSPRHKVRLYC
jgi:hypothetical protein